MFNKIGLTAQGTNFYNLGKFIIKSCKELHVYYAFGRPGRAGLKVNGHATKHKTVAGNQRLHFYSYRHNAGCTPTPGCRGRGHS